MSTTVNVNSAPVVQSPFATFQDGVDSSQQAVPVPIVRGRQKVPVIWSSVIYNLNAQPAAKTTQKK